ncbi:MAG: cytidyltransferase [Clostridiaceae bacterium]
MNKKSIYNYYMKMYKDLLNSRFLKKNHLNKSFLEITLKSNSFVKDFGDIFYEGDFSIRRIIKLFISIFKEDKTAPLPQWDNEEWLNYLYQYTLSKSFETAVTIDLLPELNKYSEFFLKLLRIFMEFNKEQNPHLFTSKYPLVLLTDEEMASLEHPEEYERFKNAFLNENIYEMMLLNEAITGFTTLDHICGVHHLAINIGRQLKSRMLSVDLGRVSGSSAGHDIGKFGCIGEEMKRVPYLHYYYSDQWFLKHNIHYIRNVAVNHSTWDLELENLSLESLILIYCDFRVKLLEGSSPPVMHIYSLEDSFKVILNKLDNVDDKKERRYRKVYAKLLDFHEYLLRLGINIEPDYSLNSTVIRPRDIMEYSLLQGDKITENIKDLAINHNIGLMYILRDEFSLEEVLEMARSEKSWKRLRAYIKIFEEYSTYLTQNQKIQTLKFLFENLTHSEDDIRKTCADIIGILIAYFDEDYRKEIPGNVIITTDSTNSYALWEEYINKLLFPSHKLIPLHKYWLGYNLRTLCKSLFRNISSGRKIYRDIFIKYCDIKRIKSSEMHLFLLQSVHHIPLDSFDDNIETLLDFILLSSRKNNITLRLCSLEGLIYFAENISKESPLYQKLSDNIENYSLLSSAKSEEYLIQCLRNKLNNDNNSRVNFSTKAISSIYLNNLKTATEWMEKKININLITDYVISNKGTSSLQAAIHFSNLLKVSQVEAVRNAAGNGIVKLMPYLTTFERNEVAVELLRALEIEGTRFTEYIPTYLGKVLLYLEEQELEEVADDLLIKVKSSNNEVKALILKTSSITLEHFIKKDFPAALSNKNTIILTKLLGIMLNGLGDYDPEVNSIAFSCYSRAIYKSKLLSLEDMYNIYRLTAKKVLSLISPDYTNDLLLLSNSQALNEMYKFISEYTFIHGLIPIASKDKIAFFPGTFDPFSISHKEIAIKIRDLGYEVYLAVDEFSWSKKTLPNLIRRNIIKMTMASELNIYLYPDNKPINLSNNENLEDLKESFNNLPIFIVTGSDVILNASSYKLPPKSNSIHSFSHIVIDRGRARELKKSLESITGEIVLLNLPVKYKDVSSTQIRSYIDSNKDISMLIDPLSQKYIYENGFYQREPLDKDEFGSIKLDTEIITDLDGALIHKLSNTFSLSKDYLFKKIHEATSPSHCLLLKDYITKDILGFVFYHFLKAEKLYIEIKNIDLSRIIRDKTTGRIVSLDILTAKNNDKKAYYEQLLLTEVLAANVADDYQYALCNAVNADFSQSFKDMLSLFGFTSLGDETDSPYKIVDMSNPCVINYDLENFIKEPFRENNKLKATIAHTRRKLQSSICSLYPGELVIPIDSSMLHYGLIKKISKLNQDDSNKSYLGKYMCVPYGDILDRYIIPNTVTKALHTEKYFYPDMKSFKIDSFPHFLSLENQVKMIKAFNRPLILVDTILHKGYRMKALDPLLIKENVEVEKLIVGILSSRGKDLMEYQNREVDTVYFIPRLRLWFNESSMYPFMGGDALWRGDFPKRNIIPSINLILPYTSPAFLRGTEKEIIYELSKTCLENSKAILNTLENIYHKLNERTLSLLALGQVFTIPRVPDQGRDMFYDLNLSASYYLENDLELLEKLETLIRS